MAVWLADRDTIADFLTRRLGMHVIDRTERFTLLGSHARHGKLTLFTADGQRERGALDHVALRVSSLEEAAGKLPAGLATETPHDGELLFDLGEGLRLGLVEAPTEVEYDLDHVALRSQRPAETAAEYLRLGFEPAQPGAGGTPRVTVGGAFVEFVPGDPGSPEQPLLNHLAVLVDSTEEHIADAGKLGIEIDDVVDAPNTYAVFVWGPERVRVEYVEHKASFSLT